MTREEAIKVAYGIPVTKAQHEALRFLIPELRESEGDRIRDAIKLAVSQYISAEHCYVGNIQKGEIITWLEEQKEQWVPTDEQRCALAYVIKYSEPEAESTKVLESLADDLTKIANPRVPKWKEQRKEKQKEQNDWSLYDEKMLDEIFIAIRLDSGISESHQNKLIEWLQKDRPYMNCKPAEWSEEDKEMLKSIIEDVTPVGECPDYPTDEEREYYYSGQDKANWLKDLPNRFNLQPKSEWSEEDEANFKWFDKLFRAESVIANGRDIPQDKYLWFKSLRPQPKQEWSEEDERNIRNLESVLYYAKHLSDETRTELGNFLKSLRPHLSDEEIKKIRSEEYTKGFNDAAFGGKINPCVLIIREIKWGV